MNENRLWKYFSLFIRTRDVVTMDGTGMGYCFTCGHPLFWKDGDCGHGVPRQHRATKYSEKNNHLQCKACNGFEGGSQAAYSRHVDKKYGAGTWDMLVVKSKGVRKFHQFEIDVMAEEYKILYEENKKLKNL